MDIKEFSSIHHQPQHYLPKLGILSYYKTCNSISGEARDKIWNRIYKQLWWLTEPVLEQVRNQVEIQVQEEEKAR